MLGLVVRVGMKGSWWLWFLVQENLLLQLCEIYGLCEGNRLKCLHLATNVGFETEDEASEANGWGETHNVVSQHFKL
ncbi:hypothetical protein A2U01_0016693, partial [Trifolium medium]|nr:hypothetical protein [Trifolium medium]